MADRDQPEERWRSPGRGHRGDRRPDHDGHAQCFSGRRAAAGLVARQVQFDDATLAEAAAQLNHYNRKQFVMKPAHRALGGKFEARNVDASAPVRRPGLRSPRGRWNETWFPANRLRTICKMDNGSSRRRLEPSIEAPDAPPPLAAPADLDSQAAHCVHCRSRPSAQLAELKSRQVRSNKRSRSSTSIGRASHVHLRGWRAQRHRGGLRGRLTTSGALDALLAGGAACPPDRSSGAIAIPGVGRRAIRRSSSAGGRRRSPPAMVTTGTHLRHPYRSTERDHHNPAIA